MNNIFLNFLRFKARQYNIKNLYIVEEALEIDEIKFLLHNNFNIEIGIDNGFLRQKYAVQLRYEYNVEVTDIKKTCSKTVDAVIASTLDENFMRNFPKANCYFSTNSLADKTFLNYMKDTDFLLLSRDYYDVLMPPVEAEPKENPLKIGFAITCTSSRFKIVEEQLNFLTGILKNRYSNTVISVFCDEDLKEEKLLYFKTLKEKFQNVKFSSELVKSIAKAKNRSIQQLTDAECEFYFCLDDDLLIMDARAIDYYIEACREYHFMHLHLTGYNNNEETPPILIKSFKKFNVCSYGYDTGCMIVFDKSVLLKCGKWDENFVGWGHEHREFGERVEKTMLNGLHHLAIPTVYENEYVISLDAYKYKLKKYYKYINKLNLNDLIISSNINYSILETDKINLEYWNKVSGKTQKSIQRKESLLDNKELKDFFEKLKVKYKLKTLFGNKKKCIVIGANPSIYGYYLENYIDKNEDSIIIRINRYPSPYLRVFYGEKTDYITTWSNLSFDKDDPTNDKKFIIFQHELADNNSRIANIIKIFKKEYKLKDNYVMTTGFFTILMALFTFEEVEYFGFGISEDDKTNSVSYTYNMNKVHYTKNHDFIAEHKMLEDLSRKNPNRFIRLEDKFERNSINICMITDNNYAKFTQMAINDIILNRSVKTRLAFHILIDSVTEDNIKKFKLFSNVKNVEVNIINCTERAKKFNEMFKKNHKNSVQNYISGTSVLKFFIPEIFNDLDRILYLDGDVYVKEDLSEYYFSTFNGKLMSVVKDFGMNEIYINDLKFINYDMQKKKQIFYTGQIVFNLAKIREKKINFSKACLDILDKNPNIFDEEIINRAFGNEVKYLDCRFLISYHYMVMNSDVKKFYTNIQLYNKLYGTSYKNINELIEKAVVFHFHGKIDNQLKDPIIKQMWDETAKRLENFFKYFA